MRSRQPTVVVACLVLTVALGLLVGGRGPGDVDDVAGAAVAGWPHGVLRALMLPTEPYVLLPALVLVVVWCVQSSRPRDALFAVLGPSIAVAANTWLLKPLFGRWRDDSLVYPSGHTVSMVSTVVVVFMLTHGLARRITVVAGVVLLVAVTIGMVGLGYHYLTDVAGGTLFAMAAVPAVHAVTAGPV
ncbi:phosphatase PAP2 family protein [Actinophytocola sp.]|uniref:phosphatase PAP2 family protein n=1 Tax=Actinophytocola sp. TaxID=1872138 RepID=UPI002D503764|nr:phosphatase PAP2 family protein [Actinophytocola sp.]HYQ63391.1 phosphatase PAP2 family protein [Actinophytocola sp.]